MAKPVTVEEYLDAFPHADQGLLRELRALSLTAAPEATETLKWGQPAYVHERGTILFMFSGHQSHANFVVTPSVREQFAAELEGFETGKGSVKLPYGRPVPRDLLERMARARLREFEDSGVNWM